MAKKKKAESNGSSIKDQINEKYGTVIRTGDQVLDSIQNLEIISVSPALDLGLGGGIREGSSVIITGRPKSGKSTTALQFCANAQAQGKRVVYVDVENRLAARNLTEIQGLNEADMEIIRPEEDSDVVLSAEFYLNTMEKYIKEQQDLVMIVDSTSNMLPQAEIDGEIQANIRNGLPRLLAMYFKRTAPYIPKMRAIVVYITHIIANTAGGHGPKTMADCGNMLQFQADVNMVIDYFSWYDEKGKKEGDPYGQEVNWTIKTSTNGKPNTKVQSHLKYGVGLDFTKEVVHMACELRFIQKKGSWFANTCLCQNVESDVVKRVLDANEIDATNEEDVERFFKFQGEAKLLEFFDEYPELRQFIYDQIREIL